MSMSMVTHVPTGLCQQREEEKDRCGRSQDGALWEPLRVCTSWKVLERLRAAPW